MNITASWITNEAATVNSCNFSATTQCFLACLRALFWVLFCLTSFPLGRYKVVWRLSPTSGYTDDIQLLVRICLLVCSEHSSLKGALVYLLLALVLVTGCDEWLVFHLCPCTETLFTHLSRDNLVYSVLPTNRWMPQISDDKTSY